LTKTTAYSDLELFHAIAEGDEEAFRLFFHRYVPKLEALSRRLMRDDTLARDIVQEVFVTLWMKRDELTAVRVPEDWIITVTYRQCFFRLRQAKRRVANEQEYTQYLEKQESDTHGSQTSAIEAHLAVRNIQHEINLALEKLTPQQRTMYALSRNEHRSIQEIATNLNLSTQTVKNTLSRALTRIREHLVDRGIMLPGVLLSLWLK
jgi:RNA polymerase sigma-70 factor (ECF subfamily)